MTDKINKILIVVFLTLLIWTWAYMSQEKSASFSGSLEVSPLIDPSLLVTFSITSSRPQTTIPLSPIVFKGAPSQISELQKRNRLALDHPDREQLDFYYNPQELGHSEGPFKLDMKDFLQKHSKTQELALTLVSCLPSPVDVNVEALESKKIEVRCVDENGQIVPGAVPEPAFVTMYVRKGFNESATAKLTKQQIDLARNQPVSVKPYVSFGVAGVTRYSNVPVNITIQSEALIKPRSFQTTKPVGILMSQELQNNYKVTIVNAEELPSTYFLFATDDAFEAYKKMDHPHYIVITESDVVDLSQTRPKKILFNFPSEYFRSGEIEVDSSRIIQDASIKIEPVNGSLTP